MIHLSSKPKTVLIRQCEVAQIHEGEALYVTLFVTKLPFFLIRLGVFQNLALNVRMARYIPSLLSNTGPGILGGHDYPMNNEIAEAFESKSRIE